MTKTLHGVIHGRTIELERDPGIGDGQEVLVHLETASVARKWGEGIRNSAGSLADISGLDEEMNAIINERRHAVFREIDS